MAGVRGRELGSLQVGETDDEGRGASEHDGHRARRAVVEFNSRHRCQQLDANRRQTEPDHGIGLHKQIWSQLRCVEAELPNGRDDPSRRIGVSRDPDVDVGGGSRMPVIADGVGADKLEATAVGV